MALVEGTNCGFVTVAPTDDPAETSIAVDNYSSSNKFTSPIGAGQITEIGWWCDTESEEANFEVGLYSHNSENNAPETRLYVNNTNAKGTTAGWKRVTGLSIPINAETIYWLAFQIDDTATPTKSDYASISGRYAWLSSSTTLPNPWGATDAADSFVWAIYAVWGEAAPPGTNMKINISGVLKDVDSMKINIGGVLKDVVQVQQNIGGVLKNVFG